MYTLKKMAKDVLSIEGDEFDSQFLRAPYVYKLSISLLFPPPQGGTSKLEASKILYVAKITAAARLFDYRAFNLDSAWGTAEHGIVIDGITHLGKTLRTRALFADRVASSLFRNHLFHPRRGISYLREIPTFELTEEDFETRKSEMETMAELVNIYMLCAREIKERSRTNGIDVVINLYLDSNSEMGNDEVMGEKTLSNNWTRLNRAAVFHYLHKFEDYSSHPIFSPPAVGSTNFAEVVLTMSDRQSILELLQAYDYVSNKLNSMFELGLPITGVPSTSVELRDNSKHRDQFLKHLK